MRCGCSRRCRGGIASLLGSVFSLLPSPVITPDQVEQLKVDNVVSAAAQKDGRAFAALGIEPQAIEAILPSYLWQYRPAGQFSHPNAA